MPLQHVNPPRRLDVTKTLAALLEDEAAQLERLDLSTRPGRVIRGPGLSRSDDVAASSSTIISAGVFNRRDCRKILVDQSAGGTLRAHMASSRYATPPCVGPLPSERLVLPCPKDGDGLVVALDGQVDQASGCCNGQGCHACSGNDCADYRSVYDIDITVSALPVAPTGLTGSRTIKPCIAACGNDCLNIDKDSRVWAKVTNDTLNGIHVQFYADFNGVGNCQVKGRYNCDGGVVYSNGNGAWFFFCVPPMDSVEACLSFLVHGSEVEECCNEDGVTVDNWSYEAWCVSDADTPADDCCDAGGCSGYPGC